MAFLHLERARSTKRIGWVSLLGLILVPLAIGGLLLWGLWNPTDRLGQVKAAVVNNDTPVTVGDQTVPLGRQLAAGLVAGDAEQNYTWTLTDADDAADGLASGEYATVVTIPSDFSKAATSYSGDADDAVQATIDVKTSDTSRLVDAAISQTITTTATSLLNEQLTTTYLENVFVGFTTLHDQLGDAASGATELAGGATQLGDGAATLADGTGTLSSGIGELATGASDLSDGVGQLSTGASDLSTGITTLAGGAADLSTGVGTLATGIAGAQTGATALQGGANDLATGLDTLATGTSTLAGSTQALATAADGLPTAIGTFLATLGTSLEACQTGDQQACATVQSTLAAAASQDPASNSLLVQAATVSAYANGIDQGVRVGTDGTPSLAAGTATAAAGARTLADSTGQLAGGLGQLSTGAASAATGASQLSVGASTAAAGASQLADGASTAAAGGVSLADGASSAASGASELAGGATSLADGATELGTGTTTLADGLDQAVAGIPSYTDEQSTKLADVVTQPVSAGAASTDLFGASGVPLFAVIALWLGALASFLVLRAVPGDALTSTRTTVGLAFRSFAPALAIALIQGVAIAAVMQFVLKLDPIAWIGFAGLAALAAAAFAAVNQGLVAILGGIGRFISMLIAVVGLAAGIVSTVPTVFTDVLNVLPLSTALNGMLAISNGTTGGGGAAVALVVWLLAGFTLTALAVARRRTVRVAQLSALPVSTTA